MSKTYLEPAGDHLLVADSPRETTLDGITLPDNVRQQEMVFGTVVFVGPQAVATKPEDRICYGPYAGKTVAIDGMEFRLLREGQIEGYIRKTD
jgi:co-chaperonin GroES (HSP10)